MSAVPDRGRFHRCKSLARAGALARMPGRLRYRASPHAILHATCLRAHLSPASLAAAIWMLAAALAQAQEPPPASPSGSSANVANAAPPNREPTTAVPPPGPSTAPPLPPPSDGECVADRFIILKSSGFDPALADELRTDFATELRHRGLDVCDESSTTREPAALVEVSARDSMVIIELDDRVTHKRVGRDLTLQKIPPNGRALAIAIAIDELLRASWAELTLSRKRGDEETEEDDDPYVPGRSTLAVSARRGVHEPVRYGLAADLGYAHTVHDFDAFSLNARASLHPWGWGWFALSLGVLGSLPAESERGDAIAVGFRSTVTAGACSAFDAPMFGCGGARAGLSVLHLRGLRPEMAQTRTETALVVDGSLVGLLGVPVGTNLYMFGEAGVGGVLQGAEATDGTNTVMGVTGLLLTLHLGLGFNL